MCENVVLYGTVPGLAEGTSEVEERMSADSKRIKVMTIIALLYGLASIVAGIVLLVVGEAALVGILVIVSGVLSAILGARGALIANVPSNTPQLVKLSGTTSVLQLADSAGIVAAKGPEQANQDPLALCLSLVALLLAFITLILSRRLKKQLDAK